MEIISRILESIGDFFLGAVDSFFGIFEATNSAALIYTAFARWVFIFLALFVLLRSIKSLLRSKNPSEVWAYLHIGDYENIPITHWENVIGRAKSCDIQIDDLSVSRNHGILTRDDDGDWSYMDLGSKNGAILNGNRITGTDPVPVSAGDELQLGAALATLFPVSIEEHRNNVLMRREDTKMVSPWPSLVAITIFQIMTIIQLKIAMGEKFYFLSAVAFIGLSVLMWGYVMLLWSMKRRGFEIEIIGFFLSTLSLAVTATSLPGEVFKQFFAILIGVILFFLMCALLRDLDRVRAMKPIIYILAIGLLAMNMVFGVTKNGASNWMAIGGFTMQPSEIVKLAFIWVGAATMEELFRKKNSMVFTIFSALCFACLAKMGDFGTAIIFFVAFLIISFLRSGDFTRLIVLTGVAFAGGLVILRWRSYIADRVGVWGHVWDDLSGFGYQQTRTMTAGASGGFVGLGAGNGWLGKYVPASETDLVFGVVQEEWGLIIAFMAVISIITLSIFAYRSIYSGRSTYYTIAACSAMAILLFQTTLNVFGSLDLLPLTGVPFPFLAAGGTSMIASWGLIAFLKAADTRQNASLAVASVSKGMTSSGVAEFEDEPEGEVLYEET